MPWLATSHANSRSNVILVDSIFSHNLPCILLPLMPRFDILSSVGRLILFHSFRVCCSMLLFFSRPRNIVLPILSMVRSLPVLRVPTPVTIATASVAATSTIPVLVLRISPSSLFARWFQPGLLSVFLSQQTSINRTYKPRNQPTNRLYIYIIKTSPSILN